MRQIISLFLLLLVRSISGETCYTKELFPKMFADKDLSSEVWAYSITASDTLNMVFQGGKAGLVNGGAAWIMAVNLDNNRV